MTLSKRKVKKELWKYSRVWITKLTAPTSVSRGATIVAVTLRLKIITSQSTVFQSFLTLRANCHRGTHFPPSILSNHKPWSKESHLQAVQQKEALEKFKLPLRSNRQTRLHWVWPTWNWKEIFLSQEWLYAGKRTPVWQTNSWWNNYSKRLPELRSLST